MIVLVQPRIFKGQSRPLAFSISTIAQGKYKVNKQARPATFLTSLFFYVRNLSKKTRMNKAKKRLISKILKNIESQVSYIARFFFFYIPKSVEILIKERHYEKRFGIETSSIYLLRDNLSLYRDGEDYQPTPYKKLEKVVEYLRLSSDDVCIDLGCGKGRVVFFFASQNVKKVIGVELVENLVKIARKNLNNLKIKDKAAVEIFHGDVTNFNFEECTIFFLFNPFGYKTLEKVIFNIKKTLVANPRGIRILYYNPVHHKILDQEDWLILEGQVDETDIFVWRNNYGELSN
jgi:SAM-dependent methyltransferase